MLDTRGVATLPISITKHFSYDLQGKVWSASAKRRCPIDHLIYRSIENGRVDYFFLEDALLFRPPRFPQESANKVEPENRH